MLNQMLRDKFLDAYMASIPLIILNVIWFMCSLPIVTLIPATAALFYATNRMAHGKAAGWQTFMEGFRRYFWHSWLWGLLNVMVVAVLVSNELFYARTDADWSVWLRGAVLALGFFWFSIQMYTFPFLLEQEQPRLGLALRNSMVILVKYPFFTVRWTLLIALVMIASTVIIWPVWMFATASVCAFLANRATLTAIARITGRKAVE